MTTPPSFKRRKITDFYNLQDKRTRTHLRFDSPTSSELPIPGLTLWKDFVTIDEEHALLKFLNSAACTWRTDLSRPCMHFGGEYCLMPPRNTSSATQTSASPPPESSLPQIIQAPPMPPELTFLLNRFVAHGIYPEVHKPQCCIVNRYTGALGISAHTENFAFAEPVVGLSLLSTCEMRFHELVVPDGGSVRSGKAGKAKRTGRHVEVKLPGRSLLVISGDSRWKWQHEIVRSSKGRRLGWERVSLTFRSKYES